jgi:15-cis-phytoene synthase
MVMAFADRKWEHRLLSLAHEAMETNYHVPQVLDTSIDPKVLEKSYLECEKITSTHSRSFYLASNLLPNDKKRAVRALYAFCRVADDIIDQDSHQPEQKLHNWREQSLLSVPSNGGVPLAWAETRLNYQIPQRYAEQLLDGIRQDLHKYRYLDFDELSIYCYSVASTVGLMSMHIIGFDQSEAVYYAVKLGVALQMTNILRDIWEDWLAGRLYLPLEELKAFGLSEADIGKAEVDDRWRAFMRFQIVRNRRLYQEAWPGIPMLHPDGRFAVAAAAGLYEAILDDIENHDYDIFTRRAHVSDSLKLRKLGGIFQRLKSARMK